MPSHTPRVWLLFGQKSGDNHQLLALAEAVGWEHEIKRLRYRSYELLVGRLGATLLGIDRRGSDPLSPPWPDLVFSAGRRNEPVALWIRSQAAREGKRVGLVHLGRPWAPLDRFDLILTTPQYELPPRPNVVYHQLPLHRLTRERLEEAAEAWQGRLPEGRLLALLVGGSSGPYLFDRRAAEALAEESLKAAALSGLLPVAVTSRRTPREAVSVLEARLPKVYRFGSGENPYLGLLALAEAFVVTGDSISMLSEACFTGKPVWIFPFGAGRWAMRQGREIEPAPRPFWDRERRRALLSDLALRFAPKRLRRDIRKIHQRLISEGRAAWLGEPLPNPPPPFDERPALAQEVRERLGS